MSLKIALLHSITEQSKNDEKKYYTFLEFYILTFTRPKKCSFAGNRSDPISFSNCEAFAP